ncbi:hypothetical protein GCM10010912_11700 [Paenibacillus albidus]|uniref:Zinc finger DksA/TraR C4-type domain-containing protein n=1 Tax=Paenibacillus albidus TaxID=2041023 RepID=A0A917FBT0_9BACL|nr:TraR/DksA C4-type zinc finger protein [Paenibacillus albidus]GGF68345.1 hypothetical protein GCM10010912_11700 [Paenibacillus albidus]
MNHLTESQLSHLKTSLLERRETLQQHFTQDNESEGLLGDSLRMSTGELSSVDNHPGDVGTETFERSRDLAINDKLAQELEEIEAALQRMDEGTYGICIASKEEIPYERLEAIPYTAYTVEHTPARDLSDARPAEEDVMTTPPRGAGENRQEKSGRFDDAGAWESVEDYGSASSPVTSGSGDDEEGEL